MWHLAPCKPLELIFSTQVVQVVLSQKKHLVNNLIIKIFCIKTQYYSLAYLKWSDDIKDILEDNGKKKKTCIFWKYVKQNYICFTTYRISKFYITLNTISLFFVERKLFLTYTWWAIWNLPGCLTKAGQNTLREYTAYLWHVLISNSKLFYRPTNVNLCFLYR